MTLALENHGGITATPEQFLKLVKAVDSPNFGVNLDTGNFHGDDPYADLAKIAPYAVNVQVKTEISREGKPQGGGRPRRGSSASSATPSTRATSSSNTRRSEDPLTAIPRHIKTLRPDRLTAGGRPDRFLQGRAGRWRGATAGVRGDDRDDGLARPTWPTSLGAAFAARRRGVGASARGRRRCSRTARP